VDLVVLFVVENPGPRMSNHPWKGRGQLTWPI